MGSRSIKERAFSSAIWKFAERLIAKIVTLVVSIVLARILSPDDYSVVAIISIFFAFASIFISGGFNTALIQKKDADIVDYSSVLLVSLLVSIVAYTALFFLSPLISSLYSKPELIPMIRVMGLILPVSAFKSVICAYISVRLDFKKFFVATIGGTFTSAIVGITIAVKGGGAWALVAQEMTNTFIDTVLLYLITKIHFTRSISIDRIKVLFKYGWKIFVSSFIGTLYTETNPLIIGLRFNTVDLSFYTKGRSFPGLVSTTTTETLAAVLFPVLSKVQDDEEALLRYTRTYIRLASFVAFPLMLGLFAVSDNFINVVLTEKWLPAAPFVRVFCIAFMFDMIHVGNCETIKAMGRSDIYLKMEITKKTLYFATICFFVFMSDSAIMLACSFIVCTAIAIVVNSIPNKRLIGYSYKMQAIDLLPNLLISTLMCAIVMLVNRFDINAASKLIIQVLVGASSYILLNCLFKNPTYLYAKKTVLDFLNSKRR